MVSKPKYRTIYTYNRYDYKLLTDILYPSLYQLSRCRSWSVVQKIPRYATAKKMWIMVPVHWGKLTALPDVKSVWAFYTTARCPVAESLTHWIRLLFVHVPCQINHVQRNQFALTGFRLGFRNFAALYTNQLPHQMQWDKQSPNCSPRQCWGIPGWENMQGTSIFNRENWVKFIPAKPKVCDMENADT